MEKWKSVDWLDGYSGVLEVSDLGRVRRSGYSYSTIHGRWKTPMISTKPDLVYKLCQCKKGTRNNYVSVSVRLNGVHTKLHVHRLVARAFVDGFHDDLTVNHINGIITDNKADNLEWVTRARNTKHQWEIGLATKNKGKLTSGKVRIIRDLFALGASANQLSVLLDMNVASLSMIRSGKRWSEVASDGEENAEISNDGHC